MKTSTFIFFAAWLLFQAAGVHAKTALVEGTPEKPHRKILTLEVSDDTANPISAKRKLKSKLLRKAGRYKADAVTDLRYFPDEDAPSYLQGKKRYARGTLLEYTRYPQKETPAK